MLKIWGKFYLIRKELITSVLKYETLAVNFMRMICLKQGIENSFWNELKKIEVFSYKLLRVLHIDGIYKFLFFLSSLDKRSKFKSDKEKHNNR